MKKRQTIIMSPILRRYASKIFRLFKKTNLGIRFFIWKHYSQLKFGENRWIKADWGKLFVKSDDVRAFVISKSKGTQKEKILTWQNLGSLNPDLAIDIGSNYGEFTAAIANTKISIICVEANPTMIENLTITFKNFSNVMVINVAISDKNGNMTFYFHPQYSGSGSFSKNASSSKLFLGQHSSIKETRIPTLTIESLVKQFFKGNPKSIILKIDVESHELAVMKGALSLLKECNWWRAILEFSQELIRESNQNVNETWEFYSKFSGLIIDEKGISKSDCMLLPNKLPLNPPESDCDILIGGGNVEK